MEPRTDDAQQVQGNGLQEATDELMNSMTVMYMMIQEALAGSVEMEYLSRQLSMLHPIEIGDHWLTWIGSYSRSLPNQLPR